jgi:lipopolysaccharide transport protein LptA
MKKILILFFITFIIFPVFSTAEEIDITADHFHAEDLTKVAYFEGNAHIQQGQNSFSASQVIVHFNKKKKATRYEANGGVMFDLIENGIHYRGKAGKIEYSPNSSMYYFSGDVVLEDLTNNRKISASVISLDLNTGLADIKGSDTQPVHFRFEIEDRQ